MASKFEVLASVMETSGVSDDNGLVSELVHILELCHAEAEGGLLREDLMDSIYEYLSDKWVTRRFSDEVEE